MPSSRISTARASLLDGKPAANCALYAASCSLVVLIPHYLKMCAPYYVPVVLWGPARTGQNAQTPPRSTRSSHRISSTPQGRPGKVTPSGHTTAAASVRVLSGLEPKSTAWRSVISMPEVKLGAPDVTRPPGHRPRLPLPATSPQAHTITKCLWIATLSP